MTQKQFIEVVDGEEVAFLDNELESDTFLFVAHGFGGNKERQGEYLEAGEEHGYRAIVFEFRGNGESSGEFIEQTLTSRIEDLKAVVNHFEPEEYVLFGTSFGGKVAFHAALDLDPGAVIGKAPVTYNSIMDKFRSVVEAKDSFEYIEDKPIDNRFIEDLYSYDFADVEEGLEVPVAIFHGSEDTTVHTENSFRAAGSIETEVSLYKLPGEKHSFTEEGKERLLELMFSWLDLL